jgi:hypothetical protein
MHTVPVVTLVFYKVKVIWDCSETSLTAIFIWVDHKPLWGSSRTAPPRRDVSI